MARLISLPTGPSNLQLGWTVGSLLAAGASEQSPWLDLTNIDVLRIVRTATTGVYALEVDWSRDGAAVDVTEVITVNNNASAEVRAVAKFARLRVRNTDAIAAFTAHRTTMHMR